MRIRLSFRAKLGIALFALAVGTAAVVLHQAWRKGRAMQLSSLQSLLRTTTAAVAPEIDGDLHAAIPASREAAASPAYARLRALARRLTEANPRFKEVYTVSVANAPRPGWGRLVLTEKEEEIGREYEYARFPAMVRGLEAPAADDDLVEDEYGITISGYAPIRDRAGATVGLLGIDVDATTVAAMRRDLLGLLLASGVAGVVLGALVAWFLSKRIGRPVAALVGGMDRVAEGDLDVRIAWRSGDEFERLFEHFNRMTAGLEERQRLKQALALAMEIQQHLLPAGPPDVAGVDVAGVSVYCDETGGDYYDYPAWSAGDGRVALTVGDVTGHGVGAALLMASGRAVLRTHAERGETPGEILALVNRHLAHDATQGKFMTLFYGVLDPVAGTLAYANAGQGGCHVWRAAEGRFEEMAATGPPLGVVGGIPYPEGRVTGLAAGDVVVLATDGIWESANASGEMLGMEGMLAAVRAAARRPAAALVKDVIDAAAAHRGAAPQADDITLVVARLDPSRPAPTAPS